MEPQGLQNDSLGHKKCHLSAENKSASRLPTGGQRQGRSLKIRRAPLAGSRACLTLFLILQILPFSKLRVTLAPTKIELKLTKTRLRKKTSNSHRKVPVAPHLALNPHKSCKKQHQDPLRNAVAKKLAPGMSPGPPPMLRVQ